MSNYPYPATLLPPNHNALDRHLEQVIRRRFDGLPVEILRDFWRPDKCPDYLLPHLARQYSVDIWRDEWSEERKRAVVAAAPHLHRIKGTRAAIELALTSYGQHFELTEWWERGATSIPGYAPHYCTAWLQIDGNTWNESGISLVDLVQSIKKCKRMTLHIGVVVLLNIDAQDFREMLAIMPTITECKTDVVMELKPKTAVGVFMILKEAA